MVKIEKKDDVLMVFSPYNDVFISWARQHGGKWNAGLRAWGFPVLQEEALRAALKSIYCWVENMKFITVEYNGYEFYDGQDISIGNYKTVHRDHRDRPVKMIYTEVIGDGEFPERGGSMKHPNVKCPKEIQLRSKIPNFIYDELEDEVKKLLIVK